WTCRCSPTTGSSRRPLAPRRSSRPGPSVTTDDHPFRAGTDTDLGNTGRTVLVLGAGGGLAHALAWEIAGEVAAAGITANVVVPGRIATSRVDRPASPRGAARADRRAPRAARARSRSRAGPAPPGPPHPPRSRPR